MPDVVPVEGAWYVLKAAMGNAHGALPQGASCQVTHVLPPGSVGVGVLDADVVVLRHLEWNQVTKRITQRRFTVRLESFSDLFAEGNKPTKDLRAWDMLQKNKEGGA